MKYPLFGVFMWPFYTFFLHCARSTLFQWQRQAHLIFLSISHWRVFVMLLRGDIGSRAFSVVCVAVLMLVCCVCGSTYEDLLLDESLHRRQHHPEIDWWRSIGIPSTRWSRPTLFPSVFQSPFRISCVGQRKMDYKSNWIINLYFAGWALASKSLLLSFPILFRHSYYGHATHERM